MVLNTNIAIKLFNINAIMSNVNSELFSLFFVILQAEMEEKNSENCANRIVI